MKNMTLDVPGMYGDHHVLLVRQVLLALEGVGEVTASAARRKVAVRFDETVSSAEAIQEALASVGYAPEQSPAMTRFPKRHEDGSEWYVVLERTTTTERKDREMAGDFRRY
jgi:copper chaperone CopZ